MKDCYIVWDENVIYIQCVECYMKNKKGILWPAINGYGQWEIRCKCGNVIKEKNQSPL